MRLGRGSYQWYDVIIFGLAAVIVYPDRVLDWIGQRTGRAFDWPYLLLVEVLAVVLMILTMDSIMPMYPGLQWWYPLAIVGMLGAVRGIVWFIDDLFGF